MYPDAETKNTKCLDRLKREFRSLRRTVIGDPDHQDEGLVGEVNKLKTEMQTIRDKNQKMILYVTTAAAVGSFIATVVFQTAIHFF